MTSLQTNLRTPTLPAYLSHDQLLPLGSVGRCNSHLQVKSRTVDFLVYLRPVPFMSSISIGPGDDILQVSGVAARIAIPNVLAKTLFNAR